jgi:hypothetical protein
MANNLNRINSIFSTVVKPNYHATRPNGGSVFSGNGWTFQQKGGVYDIKDADAGDPSQFHTHRASTLDGATLLHIHAGGSKNTYLNIISLEGQEQAIKDRLAELGHADTPANRNQYAYYLTTFHQSDMGVSGIFGGMTVEPEKIPYIKPSHRTASIMIPPNCNMKIKKKSTDMIYVSNGIGGRGGGPRSVNGSGQVQNLPTRVSITVLEY